MASKLTATVAVALLLLLGACGGSAPSPGLRAARAEVAHIRSTLDAARFHALCRDVLKPTRTIPDRTIGAYTAAEMTQALREACK
jgi:hypothetical protein